MSSMDKKGKIALPSALGGFLFIGAIIRSAASVTGEADDVRGFFGLVGKGFALFAGDPLAWCGLLLVGIVAIVCREDIRAWWNERSHGRDDGSNRVVGQVPAKPSDDTERLNKAMHRIADLIREIPSPPRVGGEPAFSMNPHALVLEAMFGKEVKDWKADTLAGVQGLLSATIADRYNRCLQQENPQSAAKSLLESVHSTLTLSDLRGAGHPDPKQEAERLLKESEYQRDLSFAQHALQVKKERLNKIQSGMIWLVGEAETNKSEYTAEEGIAWVQSANEFIAKLQSSHRTHWGCAWAPNFEDFRIAVAGFRALADNLKPEDIPD